MPFCAVFGCCNSNRKNAKFPPSKRVSFYSFPAAEPFRSKWVHFCGRKDPINITYARICSVHFTQEDRRDNLKNRLLGCSPKRQRKLKADAVPSQNGPKTPSFTPAKRKAMEERSQRSTKRANHLLALSLLGFPIREEDVSTMESAEATIREHLDVSDGGSADEEEVMIKEEAITVDHGMLTVDHHDGAGTPSISLAPTHQPVKDEADILRDGGAAAKEEVMIKEEAIMEDDDMITVDHQDGVGTPSSSLAPTHHPVKEEPDILRERNSYIGYVIIKDELVIKEEPMSADDAMAHDDLQADPTSTSPCLASQRSHSPIHGQSSEMSHACDFCDFRTGYLGSLKRHMMSHTGEKPHACGKCDYRTGRLCHLKIHMRTHTGEKPYNCDVCDYRTGDLSSLKRHKWTHTGEKPHACDICDYRTGRLSDLKTHMVSHSGEKPYNCDICDYGTGQLSNLKTHIRTHTGEKPYNCDICDYRTGQLSNLKSHMRTHTGEKPYNCDVCDYGTGQLSNLKTHMRTHPGD